MKSEIFTLYLGGSIRHKKAADVIKMFNENKKYIEDRFAEVGIPIIILSPIRGKNCEDDGVEWKAHYELPEVIARDESDVRRSHMLLNLTGDTPSDGAWWEMGLAHYVCNIPVVMIAPLRKIGKVKSWSNYKATFLGSDSKEVVDWILDYWLV